MDSRVSGHFWAILTSEPVKTVLRRNECHHHKLSPIPCQSARLGRCLPCALLIWGTVQAQDRIFRCGNEYTNNPAQSQRKDCVALDGGHITVIPAPRTNAAKAGGTQQAANASAVQSAADSSRIPARPSKKPATAMPAPFLKVN